MRKVNHSKFVFESQQKTKLVIERMRLKRKKAQRKRRAKKREELRMKEKDGVSVRTTTGSEEDKKMQ